MIDFLLGVPGKLKTISDYLTTHFASTRAAKIDNLDAAISTRAAAATALTNATWTDVRAAKLDSISATGAIKSIQTGWVSSLPSSGSGEDANYLDITIAAVTTSKSIVMIDGNTISNPTLYISNAMHGRLTSTTNLRVSGRDTYIVGARWTVVEFA